MSDKKKVIFITGSSSGIGFELAKKFLDLGFEIAINSNNIRNLKKASKFLNNCKYFLGDVTNIKSLKKIFFLLIFRKKNRKTNKVFFNVNLI